jgi:hypothetical protein
MPVRTLSIKDLAVRGLSIAALVTVLTACALPQTTVRTGSAQPSLVVKGAPSGTVLYVDGLPMGPAPQFDGNPDVLAVLEGVHLVEIRQGTAVIYHDRVFLSSGETHPITVLPGASQ